jgi:hypothetical protein
MNQKFSIKFSEILEATAKIEVLSDPKYRALLLSSADEIHQLAQKLSDVMPELLSLYAKVYGKDVDVTTTFGPKFEIRWPDRFNDDPDPKISIDKNGKVAKKKGRPKKR